MRERHDKGDEMSKKQEATEVLLFASNANPRCREIKTLLFKIQEEHKFRVRLVSTEVSNLSMFKQHEVKAVPSIALVDADTGQVHQRALEIRDIFELRSTLRDWGQVK